MGQNYHPSVQKYVRTIRAHEFAQHQRVSLLDVHGIGRGTIRALWKTGITTADQLLEAPVSDIVEKLQKARPGISADRVEGWHRQIAVLLAERHDTE